MTTQPIIAALTVLGIATGLYLFMAEGADPGRGPQAAQPDTTAPTQPILASDSSIHLPPNGNHTADNTPAKPGFQAARAAIEGQEANTGLGYEPIAVWDSISADDSFEHPGPEHIEQIQLLPGTLDQIEIGQELELLIPQAARSYITLIDSTHNQLNGVKIWKGTLDDGGDKSNVTITEGEILTFVTISSVEGVFSVEIDNATGRGTMIDEREYKRHMADQDDSVAVPSAPISPPAMEG